VTRPAGLLARRLEWRKNVGCNVRAAWGREAWQHRGPDAKKRRGGPRVETARFVPICCVAPMGLDPLYSGCQTFWRGSLLVV
jgi:hypothetical protein